MEGQEGVCSEQRLPLSLSTVPKEQTEGGADGASQTCEPINDLVKDSFCCTLIISLYKGNFLKIGDWAGQQPNLPTV